MLRTERVISKMIDRIKALFDDVVVPQEEPATSPDEWTEE